MKKKLIFGVYNPSIILTYISVFCAIVGMAHLMKSETIDSFNYMRVAIPLLIASGVCDMFDGAVARRCKRTDKEKEFGVQLESHSSARANGSVGGEITKRLVTMAQSQLKGKQ